MIIRYQLVHPNARVPTQATEGSAGWDLYLPDDYWVCPLNQIEKVSLGLRIEISHGWEASIRPRSGLSIRGIHLVNSPATIDSDYRGEVYVAFTGPTICLKAGERVAQMLFSPVPEVRWERAREVDLSPTTRGEGGFGSTGK
jgi:dUTP pyrophosphatase